MLLSDGAEFLPKSSQDPEIDRKDNELKWLLWGRVGLKLNVYLSSISKARSLINFFIFLDFI
jgi:hypothetical protein